MAATAVAASLPFAAAKQCATQLETDGKRFCHAGGVLLPASGGAPHEADCKEIAMAKPFIQSTESEKRRCICNRRHYAHVPALPFL